MFFTETINRLRQIVRSFKKSNFYRGLTQTFPDKKSFSTIYNSPTANAICQQILYFNIIFYLLPVIIFSFIFNPIITLVGNYIDPFSILNNVGLGIGNFYLAQTIIIMFVYNTILTISATNAAEAQSPDIKRDEGKICDCPKKAKLQSIIKGPLYYLSNHITTGILRSVLPSVFSLPLKIPVYGQALAETYLSNTGACVHHRREWLAKHNVFALGIGTSFVLTTSFLDFLITTYAANLGSLGTFIAQDAIFNLLWLFFIFNIHLSPSMLLSSTEYSCDLFRYNSKLVDMLYDDIKPKVKALVEKLENGTPNPRIQAVLSVTSSIIIKLLPRAIKDPRRLITSPPVQLFFSQHRKGLLATIAWIQTISEWKTVILKTEGVFRNKSFKKFSNQVFPETLIKLFFFSLKRNLLSETGINILRTYINKSKINALNNSNFILRFIRHLGKNSSRVAKYGFVVVPGHSSLPTTDHFASSPTKVIPAVIPKPRKHDTSAHASAEDTDNDFIVVSPTAGAALPAPVIGPSTASAMPSSTTDLTEWVVVEDDAAWVVIDGISRQEIMSIDANDFMPLYHLLSGRMTNEDLPGYVRSTRRND